jgi:geranylgeranyl diphosphate synthase type II
LLTAAFEQLTRAHLPAERIVEAVGCLSRAAGSAGMVGGQALDMAGEGKTLGREELELLQRLKTGALISSAAELGCIAAGGTPEQRARVRDYAQALGQAFQVRDDMLDVISSQSELGKPVGSDRVNEKSTYVTALGLEGCAALVEELTRRAARAVDGFAQPEFHIWLAKSLAQRTK